ncbi:alpha/beta hydrolase [Niallia sp. 01092]|uniref:alpha/beta hydrolase n=1 Tax=unclassified Niallia TaxID=2837522 RepID=UPI003FD1386D
MIFSKIIDLYALNQLHKNRSKEFQYSSLSTDISEVRDRMEFYQTHPIDIHCDIHNEDGKYKAGTFKFQSLLPSGDHSNDHLVGDVFLNKNEGAPNVIFVHGWRMNSFDRVKKIFHNRFMKMGWNLYYFPLPYHLKRKPEHSLYSGEYMISANIQRTVQSTRQAVVDLRALIQWIKANKKGPVILIGVSLGGFITNLAATIESQIDALVSVFYANRLSYSIWNTIPGKLIREDLEHHGVNYHDLINYWRITEPCQAMPIMKKDNILLISAKYDQYVHSEDTNYLWESWRKPKRFIYHCGHAGIVLHRKKIATDTISFLQNKIKG